jgi:hypothetical protein
VGAERIGYSVLMMKPEGRRQLRGFTVGGKIILLYFRETTWDRKDWIILA